MSHVQNPLIGRTTGQAGGMVFSTLYGQNVMRSKPSHYRENNTPARRKKKVVFKAGSELTSKVKSFASALYPVNVGRSGAYGAMMADILTAFDAPNEIVQFKPANALIGKGPSSPFLRHLTYSSLTHLLTMTWNDWIELWLRLFPLEADPYDCSILIIAGDRSHIAVIDVVVDDQLQEVSALVPANFSDQPFFYSGLFVKNPTNKNQFRTFLATSNAPTVY